MTACQEFGQAVHFVKISEQSYFRLHAGDDYVITGTSSKRLSRSYRIGNQEIRFD